MSWPEPRMAEQPAPAPQRQAAICNPGDDAPSRRLQLYGPPGSLDATELVRLVLPGKAMRSEYGWIYLVNDTNEFLESQFGPAVWSPEQREQVRVLFRTRAQYLAGLGVGYAKFIVPEKSVVYPEFLPGALNQSRSGALRPAEIVAIDSKDCALYLGPALRDAKSYGTLYFRGDSHTNWLGAWTVYRLIIGRLAARGMLALSEPIGLSRLAYAVGSYEGDLYAQLHPDMRAQQAAVWPEFQAPFGFEQVLAMSLPAAEQAARPVPVPAEYKAWFTTREQFVYERRDGKGQRAVIFRDSTLDHCQVLLAQHFARSVFIWHGGQVYREVLERERPDIVIHVMAERFVVAYPRFAAIASVPA